MSLMGRHTSNHSESPVRGRGSPHRRSPSGRDHRSSHRDSSPVRDKLSSRGRSPKRERSHSHSPFARHKGSQRGSSPPATEKISSRAKSPRREKSRSPSPRTKRLRRVQAEEEAEKLVDRDYEKNHRKGDDKDKLRVKETDKLSEREHERNYSKGDDKSTRREMEVERDHERNRGRSDDKNSHRERGTDKENGSERKERRSGRDEVDEKSSRGRQRWSPSPSDRHHKSKRRSRSPQSDVDIRERDEVRNSRASERRNGDEDSLAKMKAAEEALEAKKKQEPSFELSGKLAAETNRVRGVTLLFNEPSEARKPDIRWRLYVFKGGEMLNEPLYIHRQSCYLFGRERRVADIPTDHPSCSKQHAVIQFRQVEKEQPDGTISKQVRPYLMDLGSTNKTFLNDNPIEPQRYYELVEEDTIKFGNSSREYVLLHENSVT